MEWSNILWELTLICLSITFMSLPTTLSNAPHGISMQDLVNFNPGIASLYQEGMIFFAITLTTSFFSFTSSRNIVTGVLLHYSSRGSSYAHDQRKLEYRRRKMPFGHFLAFNILICPNAEHYSDPQVMIIVYLI